MRPAVMMAFAIGYATTTVAIIAVFELVRWVSL